MMDDIPEMDLESQDGEEPTEKEKMVAETSLILELNAIDIVEWLKLLTKWATFDVAIQERFNYAYN